MKAFYISITFIVVFYVNMLQQLHLPVNLINGKHDNFSTYLIKPITTST